MAINVSIDAILKHLGNNVKFYQPIYEAVVNSIEAGAQNINIDIYPDTPMDEQIPPVITGFKITDDGEGFTAKNRNAFSELWTENKIHLGCKGSGRFTWLNVFNKITIESKVASEQAIVRIPFDVDFSKDKIQVESSEIQETATTITFSDVTSKFFSASKKGVNDKRKLADAEELRESIMEYLLIKLFFLKRQGKKFCITIKCKDYTCSIKPDDVPDLEERTFDIYSELTHESYDFTLYYHFTHDAENSKKVFYCANNRATQKIDNDVLGFSCPLPQKDSIIMLLCSDYFEGKDDDSRSVLIGLSNQKNASFSTPLLMSDINPHVRDAIASIIEKHYPEIAELNEAAVESAKEQAPYLTSFFSSDTDVVKTKESLLTNARKKFSDIKLQSQKKFEKLLEQKRIDADNLTAEISEVSAIAAAELGEYILYRDNITKALSKAVEELSYDEKYIHDIFMPMKTQSGISDEQKHLLSNLWLIDDKFMTYSYAASDTTIQKIKTALEGKTPEATKKFWGRLNRPDLTILFNKNTGKRDLIMVEFKGVSASKDEKNKSLTELPVDLMLVRKNVDELNSIWSYIITTIDEDFKETIESLGTYQELYTDGDNKAYYTYNKASNAHIYVLDLRSIISDAFARNKTFLDILKKQ